MFVLAFFNEEKERIQMKKLTQLSKKMKIESTKKEKRKEEEKTLCALAFQQVIFENDNLDYIN